MLCIVQDAYVTKGHKLKHKILKSQQNFIRYLTIQKRQHCGFFIKKKKWKTYRQKLHQTKPVLK